jgi:hypothetical protein
MRAKEPRIKSFARPIVKGLDNDIFDCSSERSDRSELDQSEFCTSTYVVEQHLNFMYGSTTELEYDFLKCS